MSVKISHQTGLSYAIPLATFWGLPRASSSPAQFFHRPPRPRMSRASRAGPAEAASLLRQVLPHLRPSCPPPFARRRRPAAPCCSATGYRHLSTIPPSGVHHARWNSEQPTFQLDELGEPYGFRDVVPAGSKSGALSSTIERRTGTPRLLVPDGVTAPAAIKDEELCVLVQELPPTILPLEVQALAGPEHLDHVVSVDMLHDAQAQFAGKALVTLSSADAASSFARNVSRSMIGGSFLAAHTMTLQQGKDTVLPDDPRRPEAKQHNPLASVSLFASFLASRYAGRVVVLSKVPQEVTGTRLTHILWHGDWGFEPTMRNSEWNVCLTRAFLRMHHLRSSLHDPQPSKSSSDAWEKTNAALRALVRNTRDSGVRARGQSLLTTPNSQGLLDAGRLDPIFPYNPYVLISYLAFPPDVMLRVCADICVPGWTSRCAALERSCQQKHS